MSDNQDPFKTFATNTNLVRQQVQCNPYQEEDDIASLINSMKQYDKTSKRINIIRQQLAEKVVGSVLNMNLDLSANADADQTIAAAKLIAEARGILTDIDNSSRNHVTTKLKHKDSETQESLAFSAAEILTKIKLTGNNDPGSMVTTPQNIDAAIDKQFEEKGCVILDTELEVGGNKLPGKKSESETEQS
jgi:hypothetical protein